MILNIETGKRYVGSSVDIESRFYDHRVGLNAGEHHSRHLQSAWMKYGESAFWLLLLETVRESKDLVQREQHYLDLLKAADPDFGYNILSRAYSSLGSTHPHTPDSRAKISAAQTGKKRGHYTPEHCAKISAALKGRLPNLDAIARGAAKRLGQKRGPHTLETKAKISVAHLGKNLPPFTEEHKAKISAANRGKSRTLEQRAKCSAWQTGRTLSSEHRRNISIAQKGKPKPRKSQKTGDQNGLDKRLDNSRADCRRADREDRVLRESKL